MKKSNLVKILKQELSILDDFIEGFNDVDNIHPMEVDLALSKVNDIKSELLLLKGQEHSVDVKETVIASETKIKEEFRQIETEKDIEKAELIEVAEEANIATEANYLEEDQAIKEELDKATVEQKVAEDTSEDEPEIETKSTEKIKVDEKLPSEKSISQKIEIKADAKIDEEVIEVNSDDTIVEETIVEEVVEPADNIESFSSDNNVVAKEELVTKDTILADTFSQNKPSLNDMLAGVKQNKDLASLLKDSPIVDLNKAIKLNDRIWYINELFGKNSTTYEKAIKKVNSSNNLDEALAYLFTNFNWNQERKSTISFLELVFRRFATN